MEEIKTHSLQKVILIQRAFRRFLGQEEADPDAVPINNNDNILVSTQYQIDNQPLIDQVVVQIKK